MTKIEALTAVVQVPGIDSSALQKACIDAEITPGDTYAKGDEQVIDLAAVNVLQGLIIASEGEGGFSFSISADALQARINFLRNKWNVDDITGNGQPKIRGVSKW